MREEENMSTLELPNFEGTASTTTTTTDASIMKQPTEDEGKRKHPPKASTTTRLCISPPPSSCNNKNKTIMKGKILMLHGWAQNAMVFRNKTKSLTNKLCKAGYDVVFLEGPHELPLTSMVEIDGQLVEISNGERENARAWFVYNPNDYADASASQSGKPMTYFGLDESLEIIRAELSSSPSGSNSSNNVAILGFSQGAVLAHILANLASHATAAGATNPMEKNEPSNLQPKEYQSSSSSSSTPTLDTVDFQQIKATILASGFASQHIHDADVIDEKYTAETVDAAAITCNVASEKEMPSSSPLYPLQQPLSTTSLIGLPSLHLIGQKDTSVVPQMSETLSACFLEPRIVYHEKGHVLPQNATTANEIISFLDEHLGCGGGGG